MSLVLLRLRWDRAERRDRDPARERYAGTPRKRVAKEHRKLLIIVERFAPPVA
jgi:hypothetical protein